MSEINDGGPAFPVTYQHLGDGGSVSGCEWAGMMLRDHFAGQALVGFQVFVKGGWSGDMPAEMADHIAANCYAIADAMIKARAVK
jgi:hypothetical protein